MKEPVAFPKVIPELSTKRLILREIVMADVDAYFALCAHEATMRAYGLKAHAHKDETAHAIQLLREEFDKQKGLRFGIFDKATKLLIGDAGIWHLDPRRMRGEMGGKILPEFGQQGFMSEALARMMHYFFFDLNLNALEGNLRVDNVASKRLLEKLGFKQEGLRSEFTYCT